MRRTKVMADGPSGVRLAELVASLSLATDLGLGQPMEHVLGSTRLALGLGERIGLGDDDRATVYYVGLLAWMCCTADAYERARWFGDDIQFLADTYEVDTSALPMLGLVARHIGGRGSSPLHRTRVAASFVVGGVRSIEEGLRSHCELAGVFAHRLGLGADVSGSLMQTFERWDGKGTPNKLRGEQIALPVRLFQLADIVAAHYRRGGVDAAVRVAQQRSGKMFDPALVKAFSAAAAHLSASLDDATSWDAIVEAEPGLQSELTEQRLDDVLEAVADFTDLKSPYSAGHSRAVAELAAEAARRAGLPDPEVTLVRRAGHVHDLGRQGISNAIWDKPGPLTPSEMERVRLHPYLTERMLARPAALARIGTIAAMHHERLDGSGYHRGLSADAQPQTARLLAAADVYQAMIEPRPHREAMDANGAARELRAEVTAGRLDGQAVDCVLAAAGHRVRRQPAAPAGLTPRELEVLGLVARGVPNREVAHRLHISPKTVAHHVEHIYTKIGVSGRAGATLFAAQHGFLSDLRPDVAKT